MQQLPSNFFANIEAHIAAMQAEGCDILRLDIGSPDLPPHPSVIEALAETARQPGSHGYQPHTGQPGLRQAWAEMYRRQYAVELDPQGEIVPLLGSKEGIFHLIQACIDPGDVVLGPDPAYMTYERGTLFAGGQFYPLPLLPQNGFLPDLDSVPVEVLKRAKMLWLNYPNNPTAAVATSEFFARAVEFARRHDLLLCHDAAYTQVVFDGYHAPSLLEIPGAKEVAVEINSLSKSHNMAGWRVGAAAGSRQALAALFRLKTNVDSSHFLPVLQGALAAMQVEQSWIDARNEVYRQRRDIIVSALHEIGLPVASPKASIYVWSPVPAGWSSLDFTNALLEQAHVSLTPGTVFGPAGEGFARIAFTAPNEKIEEAMRRLAEAMPKIRSRS